ncbi:UbiA family prenyltransferase [soil metagenome]
MTEPLPCPLPCPLVVELDGALGKVDSVREGIALRLLRRPLEFFRLLGALFGSRPVLVDPIAHLEPVDAETLPLRRDFLDYLEREHASGRELHLSTSAPQATADAVASRVGLFVSASGSQNGQALAGDAKLQHLQQKFPSGFAYAGARSDDLTVWRGAKSIVLVAASPATRQAAERLGPPIERAFAPVTRSARDWIRALRLHQWSKNFLLFVPLLLSHRYGDMPALLEVAVGFLLLGCIASGTYLINDLSDLRADRGHPTKRFRLVARGDLGAGAAVLLALGLIAVGLLGGLLLDVDFCGLLLVYLVTTLAYSLRLKRVPIFDAFVLATLYTLRVCMGSTVIHSPNSPWLLSFTLFTFFSLSMAKRHLEIVRAPATGDGRIAGRGYLVTDAPLTLAFGVSSSLCAILILILYVANVAYPIGFYVHPDRLWLIGAWVFLWFARIWLLTHRGELTDDPVLFAIRDRWSYVLGALVAASFVTAVL